MSARFSVRRWLPCVAGVVSVALLAGAVWYDQQHLRPERHKRACKAHLKQLLTALHSYHDEHHCFPPAYTLGPDGERWHSWRVLILPQLGEQELHAQYRFDEPWNSPHNAKLANRMPAAFGYPGEDHAKFLAIVGRVTAWPEHFSTSFRDFTDGTSNTALLVESSDSNLNWLEPRDLSLGQVLKRHRAPTAPRCVGRDGLILVGMGDGSARATVTAKLGRNQWGTLMTPCSGEPTRQARSLPPDPKSELPGPTFPPEKPASDFPRTDVLPVTADPIVAGKNYLYCCTFRMAWDGLRPGSGQPVSVEPRSVLADKLNRQPFPAGQLDPAAFLAMAAAPSDVGKITAEMARRFPGAKGPSTPPGDYPGVVIFAYLRKSLAFAIEFDALDEPLAFPNGDASRDVNCFGRKLNTDGAASIAEQVLIRDYRTDDDFILELATESKRDVLTLAKIPPEATLQLTMNAVRDRVAKPNPQHVRRALEPAERLAIPKLSLNILKGHSELVDLDVDAGVITKADQGIAFVLNERGAELESFAEIAVVSSFDDPPKPPPPPKIRHFVFDKPFLVLLREKQATEPYFALWVANAELMEPFVK